MIHNLVLNSPVDHTGIDISEADIILFSIPRSGSMMLFQLLQGLCPFGGVVYTHSFLSPPASLWCLCSYREFRAATVSHWRYRTHPARGQVMSESEVRRFAGCTAGFIDAMNRYKSHPRLTWLKYEDHGGDPLKTLQLLATDYTRETGQDISGWLQARANVYLSQEPQRQMSSTLQLESLHMNPGHVSDGSNDCMRWLTASGWALMTDLLSKDLCDWGYPL
jgi:hypothetical protein